MSFEKFVLQQQYKKVQGLGDRLDHIKGMINWEKFRSLFADLFYDDDEMMRQAEGRIMTKSS